MRRATVSFVCIVLALSLTVPAWGGGLGILGVGAKAKGMGGAFRAIADDWSAAYYNPAGLFYVTENQLTFNEVFTNYQLKYSPDVNYGGYDVGFFQGDIHNRYEILTNPTLGGYVKLPIENRDVVMGLSIFQPFDANISWKVFHQLNNDFNLPGQQIEHNFDAVAINWVGAIELKENKLSLGISAGVLKADLVYGGFFLRPNPADPNATYYDQIASRPNGLITEWQRADGDGFAPNFRAGLLYKATPKLNMGVSFALKTTVTVDGEAIFNYYMPDIPSFINRNEIKVFQDSLFYILASGADIQGQSSFETDITLPTQIGGGLSYQVNEKLLVAGDLEYTLWEDFEGYVFKYTFDNTVSRNAELDAWMKESMSVPVKTKNTLCGSLGLQYAYRENILLRGGYSADQSPYETDNPAFFDTGLKHSFNLGLGLVFENIVLDFSTQYLHYPEASESGLAYLTDADGVTDNIVDNMGGTYSGSAWESIIQLTVRF